LFLNQEPKWQQMSRRKVNKRRHGAVVADHQAANQKQDHAEG
jgi:hypothetical protein